MTWRHMRDGNKKGVAIMKNLTMKFARAVVLLGMFGCVSHETQQEPDWRVKRMSIVKSIEALTTDPSFTKKYFKALERAKNNGKSLPVVTIVRIENNDTSDGRGDAATYQMYKRLQVAIRKTGLFDVVDPKKRAEMIDVVLKEPDAGVISTAGGVQCYGEYDPSDFVMTGEVVREETGELSLNLDMADTRDGKIFWNDVITPSDSFSR